MTSPGTRAIGYKVSAFLHRRMLIDTGMPRAGRHLARFLDADPVAGTIVTHWHEDHSGNLPLLARRGVPVAVSDATLALMPATQSLPFYRWALWGEADPVTETLRPAEHPFELVPTPGHSADHAVVWDPEEGFLFAGDAFLGVRAAAVHPGEDPHAMLESVRRMRALGPGILFDAHRGPITAPDRLLAAKAEWLEATIEAIADGIRRGEPDAAIQRRVLGPEGVVALISAGQVSKRNFVRSIRARAARPDS